jgi:undecaprenyl-diphosphatase
MVIEDADRERFVTDASRRSGVVWPVHRRRADGVRLALAIAVLAVAGLSAHLGSPTVVETNVFRLINELPSPLNAPLLGIMQVGALPAVAGFGFAALVAGRYRLTAVLLTAGSFAWGASKVLQRFVDEEPSRLRIPDVIRHGVPSTSPGLAFPASHVAVAAAMTVVASPYLGRSARRVCWLGVGFVAVARVYVGLHLPVDVIGGLALGVAVGAFVNLLFAVPVRGPTAWQLRDFLASVGIDTGEMEASDEADKLRCRSADGQEYLVKTLSWDTPDQGWLSRLWRLIAFRELYDSTSPVTPGHRADHEAHMALLAERGGVRTPPLVLAQNTSDQTGVVLHRIVPATPFARVLPEQVTEELLVDAWRQLKRIHRSGVVLSSFRPEQLLVDGCGQAWIVGLGSARVSRDRRDQDRDRAALAVTLASQAGAERAVAAAVEALGDRGADIPLTYLQPLALSDATRQLAADQPGLLAAIRSHVAALHGGKAPTPLSPTRVAFRNLLPVVGLGLAVYVLLPRLARSSASIATVRHAQWPWLVAVAAAAALTYVMGAITLMAAAGRRLSLGRTVAVQVAAAAANRVVPAGLGAAATNMRYLESAGLDRPEAGTTIALVASAGFLTHTIATAVAIIGLRSRAVTLHAPDLDATWPNLLIFSMTCIAIGWLIWARRLFAPIARWAKIALQNVSALFGHPWRLLVLLMASAGVSLGYILALAAALAAFGVHTGLGTVAGVYLGAGAIAAVAPTPGGVGPFEAAAVAALGGLGVGAGPAVATIITYRLITYWLPVAPGAVALQRLRRDSVL